MMIKLKTRTVNNSKDIFDSMSTWRDTELDLEHIVRITNFTQNEIESMGIELNEDTDVKPRYIIELTTGTKLVSIVHPSHKET